MNRIATSSRSHKYTKVLDNRKHPVRGLWKRNGTFLARLKVEDSAGRRLLKWVPLDAKTAAEAQEEFRKLLTERSDDRLRHVGRSPTFGDYLDQSYAAVLAKKKPGTAKTERVHLKSWRAALGGQPLDKIRVSHVNAHLKDLVKAGLSNRTRNVALVILRNVLKEARADGYLKHLPVEGIRWEKVVTLERRLYTADDIERICAAGFQTKRKADGSEIPVTKNAQQLADFLRLLCYCGARYEEALHLRWQDVDFARDQLTIGWDGDTKNSESRRVDFNPKLKAHLLEMHARRPPDSQWFFPSPQRGETDERAKTFRESLNMARAAAGLPEFGFHDCRHHFISFCVMSGIDFMTIARWVGHKDGGILIGKVYGHIADEHRKQMASKLAFGPTVHSFEQAAPEAINGSTALAAHS